jgi:hypothetical protein
MPLPIGDVLNRRSDLSTFVVHLARDHAANDTAANRFASIIAERRLSAGEPRGWAMGVRTNGALVLSAAQQATQRAVCFSETPLEHIYSMFADIANRDVRLRPYGLAITKMVARRSGVNPLWYVDISMGHPWRIRTALNRIVERSVADGWFQDVQDMFPVVEGMLTRRDPNGQVAFQREFWWEREWRHVGDLDLVPMWNKILWLCPEQEMPAFIAAVRNAGGDPNADVFCIDPNWGLERIVGHLIGLGVDDLTPFS